MAGEHFFTAPPGTALATAVVRGIDGREASISFTFIDRNLGVGVLGVKGELAPEIERLFLDGTLVWTARNGIAVSRPDLWEYVVGRLYEAMQLGQVVESYAISGDGMTEPQGSLEGIVF